MSNKLTFPVKDDLIQPNYPCGKADKAISIHEHGSTWAIWKLQDMSEKHMAKCAGCKNNLLGMGDDEVLAFFTKLAEETREMKEQYYKLQDAALEAAAQMLVDFLGAHIVQPEEMKEEVA